MNQNSIIPHNFSLKLQMFKRVLGISSSDLAKILNIEERTVNRWISCQRSPSTLELEQSKLNILEEAYEIMLSALKISKEFIENQIAEGVEIVCLIWHNNEDECYRYQYDLSGVLHATQQTIVSNLFFYFRDKVQMEIVLFDEESYLEFLGAGEHSQMLLTEWATQVGMNKN